MTEESQSAPQSPQGSQPRRGDDHAGAAANPEQHLMETHNLSIRVQGKEGSRGHAVWALIKEERGKVKTLTVFEGTRREAANHFFSFIHPNRLAAPAAPAHRSFRESGGGSRTGRPQSGRGQGGARPQSRPGGRP